MWSSSKMIRGIVPTLARRTIQVSPKSRSLSTEVLTNASHSRMRRIPQLGHARFCASKSSETVIQADEISSDEITKKENEDKKVDPKPVNAETRKGEVTQHDFQAETKKLLDIVARSLYSEKEVFVRELISNASDACEKMRYLQMTGEKLSKADRPLQIDIHTDKAARTITLCDSGIGMTKQEMMDNLGTIARSGSKAFMQELEADQKVSTNDIIGQFGVGFYSAFMVADRIEVYSKSSREGHEAAHHWESDGSGSYSLQEAENVEEGTKIILHLKEDCVEFADENRIKDIIKKYSSFVGSTIHLNGAQSNDLRPVWLMDPKEVTKELHDDFYRYISASFDTPRFTQHFRTDSPMDIRALFYVPESRPGLFETNREGGDSGVALYCRKILIKSKAENIVPKWMRFVKGVVDSEDIPLNLSRELLQDSAQIRKLRTIVSNKFLRFMEERARKERKSFLEFYKDYSFFLKEGIITSTEQYEKEEISKLLRFESSKTAEGELISLPEYCGRMNAGQREIYYLAAPSRQLAESSPYYEALKKKDVEILFCYESYDELVLMQLQQFDKKKMTSVEKEMRQDTDSAPSEESVKNSLSDDKAGDLTTWIQGTLGAKAAKVKVTHKLASHPCVITVEEMAAARHFIKTQGANFNEEQRSVCYLMVCSVIVLMSS